MQQLITPLRATIAPHFDLDEAISRDELVLEYQPIIDLRDGSIFAVEALIRWMHRRYGQLPPAAFLPQIHSEEEYRVLDLWVLARASHDVAVLNAGARRPVALSINVSPQHLGAPSSLTEFGDAIRDGILDPGKLIVELTESDALRDTEAAVLAIEELRSFGVRFAIDDFGTGCATLDYLARLPADFLKIDRSFIRACRQQKPAAIMEAVLALARRLRVAVVMEGLEEREHLRFACMHHAPYGQGYLLSRPLSFGELSDLVRTPGGHWPPLR